jgi:hypothetical protein
MSSSFTAMKVELGAIPEGFTQGCYKRSIQDQDAGSPTFLADLPPAMPFRLRTANGF